MTGVEPQTGAGVEVSGGPGDAPPRTGLLADRDFLEVRFGGSGGQGVILMGIILAVAATRDHRRVVQTQSYGPEARGGFSRSDVIISDHKIEYPELLGIDLLVALSDEAAHHYTPLLKWNGVFVYDSGEVPDPPPVAGPSFGAPFSRLAREVTGRSQTTNIVALGAMTGLTGVVSEEALTMAAISMVPAGSSEVNLKALEHGLRLPEEAWVR